MKGRQPVDVGQCSCVILNFNDADTVVRLVRRIHGYQCLKYILVVDNCSTDDSWDHLNTELEMEKVVCLRTQYNGGYGYGNNFGVRYSFEVLGEKAVLIVNPDVEFSEDCLVACLEELQNGEDVAVVSPLQLDSTGNVVRQFAWDLGSGLRLLLSCEFFLRHTFFPLPRANVHMETGRAIVDCVPGSFLLVDAEKFLLSGGYDHEMFLYWEETILGYRIRRMGWKTVLLPRQKYYHHHSVSVHKTIPQIVSQRRLQYNSLLVCLKEVWGYGQIRLRLARLFLDWCLLEEKVLAKLKLMNSGRGRPNDK